MIQVSFYRGNIVKVGGYHYNDLTTSCFNCDLLEVVVKVLKMPKTTEAFTSSTDI